jgi:asparagine synthase (glutamine-hydrolysing)
VFDAAVDIHTRLLQGSGTHRNTNAAINGTSASAALVLNGGGGEILRDFFHLPDAPLSRSAVYNAFYGRDSLHAFTTAQLKNEFVAQVHTHMAKEIDAAAASTYSRPQTELVYAYFRCQHWMGRNNHLANRYASFLTPLFTPNLVSHCSQIPIAEKIAGRFESQLIKNFDAKLAAYPSSYGFDFASGPDAGAQKQAQRQQLFPPWLRPYRAALGMQLRRWQGTAPTPKPTASMQALLTSGWELKLDEALGLRPARTQADYARRANLALLLQAFKLSL